jgi:hypothetical protein
MKNKLTLNRLLKMRVVTEKVCAVTAILGFSLCLSVQGLGIPILEYIGAAIFILTVLAVVISTAVFLRLFFCPHCGCRLDTHRGIEYCPKYCVNCGEKIDGDAVLKLDDIFDKY